MLSKWFQHEFVPTLASMLEVGAIDEEFDSDMLWRVVEAQCFACHLRYKTTFPDEDCADSYIDFPCPRCGYALSQVIPHD